MSDSLFGDLLANINAAEVKRASASGNAARSLASAPTNQQILDAARNGYAAHQPAVDAMTRSSNEWAESSNGKENIAAIHSQKALFQNKMLSPAQIANTQGMFDANADDECHGIFGPTLCKVKADQFFTTIGVGMSLYADVIIGGAGGVGCAWDFLKREGPRGYGYAQGEIGLALAVGINIECVLFNQLPTQLDYPTYGIAVEAGFGLGARLSIITDHKLDVRGFTIGVGFDVGAGAVVFDGHVWNFG